MNPVYTIYKRLNSYLTPRQRVFLRRLAEHVFPSGRAGYYSQFGEDAFLNGYFGSQAFVKKRTGLLPFQRPALSPGYYVDIGAFAPKQYSNTYLFYKQGWSGINVDATPGSMKSFAMTRPRDTNLEVAVSDQTGELVFYQWSIPAVINTVSEEKAQEWTKRLGREPIVTRVQTMKLCDILNQYLPPNQKISFLSIDVEGHDLNVLISNDWDKYRPELILVEDDVQTIEEVMNGETARYLHERRYEFISWIRPTLIFKDRDIDLEEDV